MHRSIATGTIACCSLALCTHKKQRTSTGRFYVSCEINPTRFCSSLAFLLERVPSLMMCAFCFFVLLVLFCSCRFLCAYCAREWVAFSAVLETTVRRFFVRCSFMVCDLELTIHGCPCFMIHEAGSGIQDPGIFRIHDSRSVIRQTRRMNNKYPWSVIHDRWSRIDHCECPWSMRQGTRIHGYPLCVVHTKINLADNNNNYYFEVLGVLIPYYIPWYSGVLVIIFLGRSNIQMDLWKHAGYIKRHKQLRVPSATRSPETAQPRQVPPTQQPSRSPAKERASQPNSASDDF